MAMREGLGENKRTVMAVIFKGKVLFLIGCFKGNYSEALKAVSEKYGQDSEYAKAIT